MSSQRIPLLTIKEYLAQERQAEFKSQFYRGEIFSMAGASNEHNMIVANLIGEARQCLKESDCVVYPSDLRLRVTKTRCTLTRM